MDKMLPLLGLMFLFSHGLANNVTEEPRREIYEANFDSRNPGSGNTEECKMHYIRFSNAYLRGVKAPNHLSFNESTYRDCERKCCYETSFVCRSFSYFRPLRQCFIMNLTREYPKVELISVVGYTHVQLVTYVEPTTPEPQVTTAVDRNDETTPPEFWSGTTASSDETDGATQMPSESADNKDPEENVTDGSDQEGSGSLLPSTSSEDTDKSPSSTSDSNDGETEKTIMTTTTTRGPDRGVLEESKAPEKIVSNDCPVLCENEGKCQFRDSDDEVASQEAYCECQDGFGGEKCENVVSDAEGFPIWIIIVIVLGSIIVILFLVVFILYQVYRRKKGEYRVVRQIQKWTRLGRKKQKVADSSKDAPDAEKGKDTTSPTTSLQSMPNSDTSNETSRTPV